MFLGPTYTLPGHFALNPLVWFPPPKTDLFIFERENKRVNKQGDGAHGERNLSKLHTEYRAQGRARSHTPGITT